MDRKEREESRRICEAATPPKDANDYERYGHLLKHLSTGDQERILAALPAALDEIDRLERELAVRDRALEKMERITATEALYGFGGWLTMRDEAVTFSASHGAVQMADLIEEWRDANGLPGCREGVFADNITHPAGAPVDPAAARAKMAEEGE